MTLPDKNPLQNTLVGKNRLMIGMNYDCLLSLSLYRKNDQYPLLLAKSTYKERQNARADNQ